MDTQYNNIKSFLNLSKTPVSKHRIYDGLFPLPYWGSCRMFHVTREMQCCNCNHCVRRYTKHWNNKALQLIWRDHLGDLRVDGKIILNWMSKYSARVWTACHTDQQQYLVNRAMNVKITWRREIPSQHEWLLASQQGLSSTKLTAFCAVYFSLNKLFFRVVT